MKHLTFAFVLLLAVMTTAGLAQRPEAQPDTSVLVAGTVVDASGAAVAGARVDLMRNATVRAHSGQTLHSSLGPEAATDASGQFSFGRVSFDSTKLDFPIEGSVSVDFTVFKDRQVLKVDRVEFVDPFQVGTARAVTAILHVR